MSAAGDRAVDQKQHDRADDGSEPRAEVEELVDWVAESERLRNQAADECSGDADQRRDDDSSRVVAREDRLGDDPCQEPQD